MTSVRSWAAAVPLLCILSAPAAAQDANTSVSGDVAAELAEPVPSPLTADFADDPILALANRIADPEEFRRIVASALRENARTREAEAGVRVAAARLDEAEAGYLPTIDLNASSYQTLARKFDNDPGNLIERSRPGSRTDVLGALEYKFFDFGAVAAAVAAGQARLRAAGYEQEAAQAQIVTDVVTAWYSVFAYQSLVRLSEGFISAQDDLEAAIDTRIERGVSSRSDRTRVASLRADGQVRLAQFRRRLASAEARFRELTGVPPPPLLLRAPVLGMGAVSREYAISAAEQAPAVQSARAAARAAAADADFTRLSQLPQITTRVDAGRYGVFEGREDYDVRASVNLRYRLFGGGGKARNEASEARADAAEAAADRVRQEAARDAAITWADVQALEAQIIALEDAYRAARQSRDVVFARFAALRGSVFDISDAQGAYLSAAVAYIDGLTQLDAARYILLARTDRLLTLFEDPANPMIDSVAQP
ncbi:TolC family protein [Qipengyuania marisflavi]|uniref:TolC family protein n=1 Tax=Qipengyuania marisflavi TaxID=2486356 RepID=UPI0014875857|nr:TolC family protein [Qipengyuania marisflavi]